MGDVNRPALPPRSSGWRRALAAAVVATVLPSSAVTAPDAAAPEVPPPPPAEPAPEPVGLSDDEVAAFVPPLETAGPGQLSSVSLTMPDGQERRYLYSTPHALAPEEPAPVLFALGGWTDPPENFLRYAGFDTSRAAAEAVVVYPAGVADAWAGAPYAQTDTAEDVSFLRAIVAQLATARPVDRERVYAVGMSNGGGLTLDLACHAEDLVAGVAAVSGAFYEGTGTDCGPGEVATQIIHGTRDELLHYDGGVLHDTPYQPVPEVVTRVAERNGCADLPPETVPLGDNADRITFTGCVAETEHIRVNGGFHDWYIDPATPEGTWDFLSRQSNGA